MGYTTDFVGQFNLDRPLEENHRLYLKQFSETRRMKRDPKIAKTLPDPIRINAGLLIGMEGQWFVGGTGHAGQDKDESIIDSNSPPKGQPSLWCDWIPNEDGTAIIWNGGEKFYDYVEWIGYIIDDFLKPWGYVLNGEVEYQGEDLDDFGKIDILLNKVKVIKGKRVYEED